MFCQSQTVWVTERASGMDAEESLSAGLWSVHKQNASQRIVAQAGDSKVATALTSGKLLGRV